MRGMSSLPSMHLPPGDIGWCFISKDNRKLGWKVPQVLIVLSLRCGCRTPVQQSTGDRMCTPTPSPTVGWRWGAA